MRIGGGFGIGGKSDTDPLPITRNFRRALPSMGVGERWTKVRSFSSTLVVDRRPWLRQWGRPAPASARGAARSADASPRQRQWNPFSAKRSPPKARSCSPSHANLASKESYRSGRASIGAGKAAMAEDEEPEFRQDVTRCSLRRRVALAAAFALSRGDVFILEKISIDARL
jgi:hypothetical protein